MGAFVPARNPHEDLEMARSSAAKRRSKASDKPERGGVQSVRIAARILKALASGAARCR